MLEEILNKIQKAQEISGKKVDIIAVTKTRTLEEIQKILNQNILAIGENRVQEAETKLPFLPNTVQKHLIGSLQSNKINKAIQLFDVIQSVESLEQAQKIVPKIISSGKKISLMIQCNTAQENSKHGICSERELFSIVDYLCSYPQVPFLGLMTIGAHTEDERLIRKSFAHLYQLKDKIISNYSEILELKLSMGMSSDFEWAILEGSDMVRLGRILFT